MKSFKLSKSFALLLLTGSIATTTLSGCSLTKKTDEPIVYEKYLDDLTEGDNQYALDYVNSLPFTNISFRNSFYDYLANGKGNCFINSDLDEVTAIELSNIDSLDDLTLFPNLKKVKISNSNINDFSKLSNLSNLEILEFNDMEVDCSTLENLRTLSLSFNKVTINNQDRLSSIEDIQQLEINYSHFGNIDFISNWEDLKYLHLCNADIIDYNVLANRNLESLSIKFCQVDNWDFINTLKSLKNLDVSYTNFIDFSLISNLTNLENLNLAYSFVSDLNGISNLKKLTDLSIDSCQNLKEFDEVSQLENLSTFNCANLEMQSNKNTSINIMLNCDEYTGCDLDVKDDVEEFYNSLNTDNMDDTEKVRIITTAVLELLKYNNQATEEEMIYYNNHELLSALDGYGMCASYTGLTSALLDLANIENYSIVGENFYDNEQYLHRWIVVKVNDNWYGLDSTFLDDINASETISNGNDTEYYLDILDDEIWQEYHYPYFMPEIGNNGILNLAR